MSRSSLFAPFIRFCLPLLFTMGHCASVWAQEVPRVKPPTKDVSGNASPIDVVLARNYFDEAERLAANDGGKLWGKSLAGPLLFVDPRTRFAVANQADDKGTLRP